jgi:hypothetical protein
VSDEYFVYASGFQEDYFLAIGSSTKFHYNSADVSFSSTRGFVTRRSAPDSFTIGSCESAPTIGSNYLDTGSNWLTDALATQGATLSLSSISTSLITN